MKTICFIVTSLVVLTGCATEGGNLILRDRAGGVVATGDLRLPGELPPVGRSFEGQWRLRTSRGTFPAQAVRSGKYAGTVQEHGVSIDLNPGVADNNVWLVGSVSNGSLRGKWQHATFMGAKEMGSFTAADPAHAR